MKRYFRVSETRCRNVRKTTNRAGVHHAAGQHGQHHHAPGSGSAKGHDRTRRKSTAKRLKGKAEVIPRIPSLDHFSSNDRITLLRQMALEAQSALGQENPTAAGCSMPIS